MFIYEGGAAVETVLGLSMTSASVGWALIDASDPTEMPLDHDAFDISSDNAADADISRHVAAISGALAIANSDGHRVKSIGVTWTDDVDGQAHLLLKSLPELGFENVVSVRLSHAAREWAHTFGPVLGFQTCAVCVIESAAVTVMAVGNGTVRTTTKHMRESADGLSRWLSDAFEQNRWQPDRLFLVGLRGDLELVSGSLEESLPMRVEVSDDAQLVLARGAAIAVSSQPRVIDFPVNSTPESRSRAPIWSRLRPHPPTEKKSIAKKTDSIEAWTEVLKKPVRDKPVTPAPRPVALVSDAPVPPVAAPEPEAEIEPEVATTKLELVATETDAVEEMSEAVPEVAPEIIDVEPEPVESAADVVEAPTTIVEIAPTAVDAKPVDTELKPVAAVREPSEAQAVATAPAEMKTEVIALPKTAEPVFKLEKRRSWTGPHARAAAVVVVGVIGVFALAPVFFGGQKDSRSTDERPASESSSTSVSVQIVPSAAAPPAAVHQVAAEPAPAPMPPPDAMPPETSATEFAAPVADPEITSQAPVIAEPMAVQQSPAVAAPIVAAPAPAAQPVAPVPAAAPGPVMAAEAPAAAAPAPPPAAPPQGEPEPQDPVMQVLSPLFGALP